MRKITTVSLVVAGLTLLGASCGKKVAEKTVENAIEKSTNGQADVDISNKQVQINTNGTSLTAGENVKLPSGFPADVYVIDGTLKSTLALAEDNGYSVTLTTSTSAADVKTKYESQLKADGWTIISTLALPEGSMLTAEKGLRTTSVTMTTPDGETMVSISTREKSS